MTRTHEIEIRRAREASRGLRTRGWRRSGDALVRELSFRDFSAALKFVDTVGTEAVDYLRRPDLAISNFNQVRVTIANPHHAGLTAAELRLAAKVDAVIAAHGLARQPTRTIVRA
jgi:4a-hydroxytetrahydrobiopterin dehydratase